jgi:hypothetical protein
MGMEENMSKKKEAGKGDKPRKYDKKKWDKNWNLIKWSSNKNRRKI